MTEKECSILNEGGIDADKLYARFMKNDDLLKKLLLKFLEEPTYGELVDAIEKGNNHSAFIASHTLKGLAANFSMDGLREKVSAQCEDFRAEHFEEGAAKLSAVKEEYEKVMSAIKTLYED